MQNNATSTPAPKQFTKEEREAFLQQKNETRKARLIEAGYSEPIANNIVAYAKNHRGYNPDKQGRHGGDWLCGALAGIVYGFRFKINRFMHEEVMLLNGCCLAFLDSLARIEKGESLLDNNDNPVTAESLINAYTTPKTTEGRLMYSLGHRCEPIDEAATGRKDFGPGDRAARMRYLSEAVIELLVTNDKTFADFYHDTPIDDPKNPRKERPYVCCDCGVNMVKNKRGYWDCKNDKCSNCRDENGYRIYDKRDTQSAPRGQSDNAAPIDEATFVQSEPKHETKRQFSNGDRKKFDSGKYNKGGGKNKPHSGKRREIGGGNAFDALDFDKNGKLSVKK